MNLVSAIMPTRGRQVLAAQALDCFLFQSWPHRELIVLDDADDPSFPGGMKVDGVHYLRLDERLNIPAKLNRCCEMATGEIICRFDSDDWSAPGRIEDQVRRMEASGRSVTGYHSMLFYSANGDVFRYSGKQSALGTSLCFRKDWWAAHRWNESKAIGEDSAFSTRARDAKEIILADAGRLMVARIHADNTSPKPVASHPYQRVDAAQLPHAFISLVRP